jgi:hypothetical protein
MQVTLEVNTLTALNFVGMSGADCVKVGKSYDSTRKDLAFNNEVVKQRISKREKSSYDIEAKLTELGSKKTALQTTIAALPANFSGKAQFELDLKKVNYDLDVYTARKEKQGRISVLKDQAGINAVEVQIAQFGTAFSQLATFWIANHNGGNGTESDFLALVRV